MRLLRTLVCLVPLALAGLATSQSASALGEPAARADLVFESGGRIVSMKADGSERSILTREGVHPGILDDSFDSNPKFSPDGSSIMFQGYVSNGTSDSESKIMVMNRDGGSIRPLFPDGHLPSSERRAVYGAAWSADSSRLLLLRVTADARKYTSELMSIRADGTGLRKLTGSTIRFRGGKVAGSRLLPLEVAPSPNGNKLLVSYNRFYGATPSRMYLVDPNTGKRKLLARDASGGSWSPDGSRIVFVSERDRLNKSCYEGHCSFDPQLYVMKANGSGVRRLVPRRVKGSSYAPDWSADGRSIAFVTTRTDPRIPTSGEIFSIRPDGKCLTRITNGSPGSDSPDWSPEAGNSAGPGTCGDAARRALSEVGPEPHILELKLVPMWLGPAYGNQLLSDIFKDGRGVMASYDDCGALKPGRCSPRVSITSDPVCENVSDSAFYDGTFERLVKRKGALVMLTEPSGGGLETISYSGGLATGIYTRNKSRGKRVTRHDHLEIADALRPVTSTEPVLKFEPAVFQLTEVQTARAVLRSWRKLGTLAAAAEEQEMFPKIAGAYLRFGKALEQQGKVLTVKCKRRSAVSGSVKLR